MSNRIHTTVRFEKQIQDEINAMMQNDEFMEFFGFKSKSDIFNRLIKIGLRELRGAGFVW